MKLRLLEGDFRQLKGCIAPLRYDCVGLRGAPFFRGAKKWRWRESNSILDFLMSHLFSFIVTNEQLVKIERCYKVTLNAAF